MAFSAVAADTRTSQGPDQKASTAAALQAGVVHERVGGGA